MARKARIRQQARKSFIRILGETLVKREDSSKAGPMNHDVFPMPGSTLQPSVERLYVYTSEQGREIFHAVEAHPF